VYVEKPLVLDESEAEELIGLSRGENLVLMVGHLLQYHPVFVRLKEIARAGELGRINYIYSNRLNLGKIRREENILWSFAPHDISMILALAG
jgi:UDP-2-acetamido-3-amino-2,3-dideoxy-glucuronate N-acetyltransferase